MNNIISDKYRETVFDSDFEYFVHIERAKGVFGFRREKKVDFPAKCAYCGSPTIDRNFEIGKPDLNLFRGIGKVPYCTEHAEHIHDNFLHQKVVYMPLFLIMTSVLVLFQEKISRIEFVRIGSVVFAITMLVSNVVYIVRKKLACKK